MGDIEEAKSLRQIESGNGLPEHRMSKGLMARCQPMMTRSDSSSYTNGFHHCGYSEPPCCIFQRRSLPLELLKSAIIFRSRLRSEELTPKEAQRQTNQFLATVCRDWWRLMCGCPLNKKRLFLHATLSSKLSIPYYV